MTQIERISTDFICENPPGLRHCFFIFTTRMAPNSST